MKTFVSMTAMLAASAAQAQTAGQPAAAPAAEEAAPAAEVVVIGSRRAGRTSTDSASPVDVIGGEELSAQPAANMLDVVRNLVPSFFVPQNTISDASTFVRPPSLRGLSADQILVMVNGKRYNRSALVQVYSGADTALSYGAQGADIANIPAISVGNLQVLRDGATAQYGSDAIGGVINYQLRETKGLDLIGQYGQTRKGDGERWQVAGYGGLKLGDRGFISVSGEYYDEKGTSRGATRPIAVVLANTQPAVANSIPNYPGPAQIWGTSPGHGFKGFVNARYDFSDMAKLYGTFNYAKNQANQSFNYRSPISAPTPLVVNEGNGFIATRSPGANGAFNTIYLTPCPTGNATCPSGGFVRNGGTTFNFTSIYPGGFTPRFIGKVEQLYGTIGIKGEADSGFTYDLSGTMARNSLDLSMTGSLNASFGPTSQTSFNFGKLIQREQNANLDLTYPVEAGLASPITLSGGLEYRREEYEKTVGDLQSYAAGPYARQPLYDLTAPGVYTGAGVTATQSPAASGYGGTSPAFAGKTSQKSWGGYVGAEADLSKVWTAGVAGRYERYETFGGTFVGKFNTLWHATDAIAFRFTAGTGFHAPSPGQNNTQIVTTNFLGGVQTQTGTYPVNSSIATYYGATSLKPEKSVNFGAGIVIDPKNGFTLTIDAYTIKVKDRIGISQNFTVTAADVTALPALAAVGVGGVVNYFTNGFDTRTSGIDFVSTYRTRLMDNPLNLTFAYSYNRSKASNIKLSTTGAKLVNAQQEYNIGNLPPRHRVNASANYQVGNFTLNVRENFYSSWSNALEYNLVAPTPNAATATSAPPSQRFGSKFLTDLDISYTFMDRYTVTIGANNLFDVYPDKIRASVVNPIYQSTMSLADGQIYPRSGGPFGINGATYYVRLRVKY